MAGKKQYSSSFCCVRIPPPRDYSDSPGPTPVPGSGPRPRPAQARRQLAQQQRTLPVLLVQVSSLVQPTTGSTHTAVNTPTPTTAPARQSPRQRSKATWSGSSARRKLPQVRRAPSRNTAPGAALFVWRGTVASTRGAHPRGVVRRAELSAQRCSGRTSACWTKLSASWTGSAASCRMRRRNS